MKIYLRKKVSKMKTITIKIEDKEIDEDHGKLNVKIQSPKEDSTHNEQVAAELIVDIINDTLKNMMKEGEIND